ncbi:MAG TPA: aminopeptidase P N-terminal domain-containing protein, partial [Longimicrobiaceae bacterium]|nr:aminopeptidase P N-terminal domain-containing protein [Longimicrobiaceae bacterium]
MPISIVRMLLSLDIGGFGPPPEAPRDVFSVRRDRILEAIGAGIALVPSAPELLKSRDTEVPYRQSSDLYYLSGLLEPESVAVLTPHDAAHRFTLFVRKRDPEREAWVGSRIGVERAGEMFGADAVYPIDELDARLPDLLKPADLVHYPIGEVPRLDGRVTEAIARARRGRQRTGGGPIGAVDLESIT